jgi:cation:H+ antiporter
VRSSSAIALSFGIAPVVIGLTVVSIGTSSPELAISVTSALKGQGDIALGNVIGSNIANILLILGTAAVITPLAVQRQIVRYDVPIMVGVSVLVVLIAYLTGSFSRLAGVFLLLLFAGYIALLVWGPEHDQAGSEDGHEGRSARAGAATALPAGPTRMFPMWANAIILIVGLALMVVGSRWLVTSASAMARAVGLSELVIGLTIVAIGTSAPELATTIVAATRKQGDLAIGNAVGSNIMNLLLVLGAMAVVSPIPIVVPREALAFDLPFMLAVAFACFPVFFAGYAIRRWEGFLFLGYYVAYLTFLLLQSTRHDALPQFSGWMLGFVIPLTVIALGISVFIEIRNGRRRLADSSPPA